MERHYNQATKSPVSQRLHGSRFQTVKLQDSLLEMYLHQPCRKAFQAPDFPVSVLLVSLLYLSKFYSLFQNYLKCYLWEPFPGDAR